MVLRVVIVPGTIVQLVYSEVSSLSLQATLSFTLTPCNDNGGRTVAPGVVDIFYTGPTLMGRPGFPS